MSRQDWAAVWRYARQDRGRTIRLMVITAVVLAAGLLVLAALIATVVVAG